MVGELKGKWWVAEANLRIFVWLLIAWHTEKVAFQSISLAWRREMIELAQCALKHGVRHEHQKNRNWISVYIQKSVSSDFALVIQIGIQSVG